jgi:two-component system response regulator NreC
MDRNDIAVRILVADDNDLMRSALCALLREHAGWYVCAEAKSGREAIEKATELKPDVALVDVSMPDLNGFEVANRIYEAFPDSKILIVTEHDPRTLAYAASQPGVRGCVMKSRASVDLIPAVKAATERQPLRASAPSSS